MKVKTVWRQYMSMSLVGLAPLFIRPVLFILGMKEA